jgi:hypothetical protein
VFPLWVQNVGWSVASERVPNAGLPTIRNDSSWVREPQRFLVWLVFDGSPPVGVRFDYQANVVIYTGDNRIMNVLGAIWIRLISILTY